MDSSISVESLWSIFSEKTVVLSEDVVSHELQALKSKFCKGIAYYNQAGSECVKLDELLETQRLFVRRIAKSFDIGANLAFEIFSTYLIFSFRGTSESLSVLLSTERHQQVLLVNVWKFYRSERLYLLKCLGFIISRRKADNHPHGKLFSTFLQEIDDNGSLFASLLHQLKYSTSLRSPDWSQNVFNDVVLQQAWISSTIKEQTELVHCIVSYVECCKYPRNEQVVMLLNCFVCHGFGRSPSFAHLLTEQHCELISYLSAVEAVSFVQCLQLELILSSDVGSVSLDITSDTTWHTIDNVLVGFGSIEEHGPVLLAWLIVLHATGKCSDCRMRSMVHQIRKLNVISVIKKFILELDITRHTASMIGCVTHKCFYHLMDCILLFFETEKLCARNELVAIFAKLLILPSNASEFWHRSGGVHVLFEDVCSWFPADVSLLRVCAGLLAAGGDSIDRTIEMMSHVPSYAQHWTAIPAGCAAAGDDGASLVLRSDYQLPGGGGCLPAGTCGRFLDARQQVVSWHHGHNGWRHCLTVLDTLPGEEITNFHAPSDRRGDAFAVVDVLCALLQHGTQRQAEQIGFLITAIVSVLDNYAAAACADEDDVDASVSAASLLANCVRLLAHYARFDPLFVWRSVDNGRLLPSGDILAGQPVVSGGVGQAIEGGECVRHSYPLTCALLELLVASARHRTLQLSLLRQHCRPFVASVCYVLTHVFVEHGQWQYQVPAERVRIALLCVQLFHAILAPASSWPQPHSSDASESRSSDSDGCSEALRGFLVARLLDSAAGDALLELIMCGEQRIAALLEQHSHWHDGDVSTDCVHQVQLALSLLHQLLLDERFRRTDRRHTRIERALMPQPSTATTGMYAGVHPLLTVAQYVFHSHSRRVPTLAVRLLARLAGLFPLSLLGCLGQHAAVVCDMLLTRLRCEADDVNLKTAIVQLAGVCATAQPGLLQCFIDGAGDTAQNDDGSGGAGFLGYVLTTVDELTQRRAWQSPLLQALVSLLAAVWRARCTAAVRQLSGDQRFWPAVTAAVLLSPPADCPPSLWTDIVDVLSLHVHQYGVASYGDQHLATAVRALCNGSVLEAWSSHVAALVSGVEADESAALTALNHWRQWLLIVAVGGGDGEVPSALQCLLAKDVCGALLARVRWADERVDAAAGVDDGRLTAALAELALMLVCRWRRQVAARLWPHPCQLLDAVCVERRQVAMRVRVAVVALTWHVCAAAPTALDGRQTACVPAAVQLLEHSLREAHQHISAGIGGAGDSYVACLSALVECGILCQLMRQLPAGEWLPVLAARQALSAAVHVVGECVMYRRWPRLAEALMQLVLTGVMCANNGIKSASTSVVLLDAFDLTQQLCLPAWPTSDEWMAAWLLCVDVYAACVQPGRRPLLCRREFVAHSVDFVAIHCGRLCDSVSVRLRSALDAPSAAAAAAAVDGASVVVRLWAGLADDGEQWRSRHAGSMAATVTALREALVLCFWRVSRAPTASHAGVAVVPAERWLRLASECVSVLLQLLPPLAHLLSGEWRPPAPVNTVEAAVSWQFVDVSFASASAINSRQSLTYGVLLTGAGVCARCVSRSGGSGGSSEVRALSLCDSPSACVEVNVDTAVASACLQQTLLLVVTQAVLLLTCAADGAEAQLIRREMHSELAAVCECVFRRGRRVHSLSPGATRSSGRAVCSEADQNFLSFIVQLSEQIFK